MKNYQGIVFDLDGTILDTERMNFVPLQRLIFEELGKEISYGELLKYRALGGKKILRALGFTAIDANYEKWVEYVNASGEQAVLYNGWREVITSVVKQGYVCGIASSKLRPQYELDFLPTQLEIYMKAVVLAEDTTEHKPHPAPLLLAAERLGCAPEKLIYVGDTIFDEQAAKQAGMDFAFVGWNTPIATDQQVKADYILTKPQDLLAVFRLE